MKKNVNYAVFFLVTSLMVANASVEPNKISFTENKGQVSDQNFSSRRDVLYNGTDGKMSFFIRNNGISYQLNKIISTKEDVSLKAGNSIKIPEKISIYRIDAYWKNCSKTFKTNHGEALVGYENYYNEVCTNGISNVRSYSSVTLKNVYKNIDIIYYGKKGLLKCDYVLAPNSDYKDIQIEIKGAKVSIREDGSIELKTPIGTITEEAPLVIQNNNVLEARWLVENNILSFEINNYNPSLPMLIDPATRVWGTYYGDNSLTQSYGTCTDRSGNVYMSGYTASGSGTTIATVGAHQTTIGTGASAFLVKFDSLGTRLWGTYYGGSGGSTGYSCTTDKGKYVYLAGSTNGSVGISTPGAHQTNLGGNTDGFLAKFDSLGVRIWGTYYGGSSATEEIYSVSTNNWGDVFIAGRITGSTSGTIIATPGSHQSVFAGNTDCFIVKFFPFGTRDWGTFYGGNLADNFGFCSTDTVGNVYLSGSTASSTGTVIATSGSHKSTFGGSLWDAFLVKFNNAGLRLWGTYYGGAVNEYGYSCTTDLSGNVFLAGSVDGNSTGIATSGAYMGSFAGGSEDAFLVKFNSSGVRQWGTYLGQNGLDRGNSCTTDAFGSVYLAGNSTSSNTIAIASVGSHQTSYGGGATFGDAFLTKFNSSGVRQWGTYYGGTKEEEGLSCAVDLFGSVYLTGRTTTTVSNIIATPGGHQPAHGSLTNYNGYLVKFTGCLNNSLTLSSSTLQTCPGKTVALSMYGGDTYTLNPGSIFLTTPSVIVTPTVTTTYTFNSRVFGCMPLFSNTITINSYPSPAFSISITPSLVCAGQTLTLSASGTPTVYFWNPIGSGNTVTVNPTATTVYSVTGVDVNACVRIDTFSVFISPCTGISELNDGVFHVYPNPTVGEFVVKMQDPIENIEAEIISVNGQLVFKKKIEFDEIVLDLSKFNSGLYYILIKKNGKILFADKVSKSN